jgi:Tfp pilus assembly protein PilN
MSSHALVVPRGEERGETAKRARSAGRAGASGSGGPLGGEPRVSLLPSEVNDFHRARQVRRRLLTGLVFLILVVLAAVAGSYLLSMSARVALESARSNQQALLAQEAQFTELRAAKSGIALIEAGQYVGASTEIDWKTYLENLQATLPDGVTITNVTIDSATPFADYTQSTVPLEGSRVATLVFSAVSPGLPTIPSWLDGLATLKGFADAVPGSVTAQDDGSSYLVNITMHINSDAFALRFPAEGQQ